MTSKAKTLDAAIVAIRAEIFRLEQIPIRYSHDPEWSAAYDQLQGLRFALDHLTGVA